MATPEDISNVGTTTFRAAAGFWQSLRAVFDNLGARHSVTAVCIPPGGRLRFEGIPRRVQGKFGVSGTETATFTQVTAEPNHFRDAVRFENGREILLQDLGEGTHVQVLDMSMADGREPVIEAGYAYTLTPNARSD